MTALPLPRPRLLTAVEFAALDESSDGRYELQDGNVVMSASPVPRHQACQGERGEYADAGIEHYWIVDIDDGVSITACHRAGEFGYLDEGPVSGIFSTDTPFPVRVDLATLG